MTEGRVWLLAAGLFCSVASALHLACIAGGPDWYRALGAGERFAAAAARGQAFPALATLAIASVLGIWAAYAFSAAGWLPPLPLRRTALVLITAVLIARGLAVLVPDYWRPDLTFTFKLWSSLAVLVLATCFAFGTWLSWQALSMKDAVK